LAQCQFNVTGWGIMFICGMVLRCAGTFNTRLKSRPVTADLTTTVVHSSKLLLNDVKPDHSLFFLYNIRQSYLPSSMLNLKFMQPHRE